MTTRRALLVVAVIVTALLLQVVGVNRLPLPVGHPDLLAVCVIAFAVVFGPTVGAVTGFAAGLLADLTPPADHTVGRLALAYAVVGYAAGLLEDAEVTSAVATIAIVAVGSAAVVVLFALVGALLGDGRVTLHATESALAATVVYDVVLAPFVVPLVAGAARRSEPAGSR